MSSRGGDFERALCLRLSADVAKIRTIDDRFAAVGRRRRRNRRLSTQMSQQRRQMHGSDDAHLSHGSGFVRVGNRNDQLANVFVTRERGGNRQSPAHRRDAAVERQLTDENTSGDLLVAQELRSVKNAERDRKIKSRSLLLHIGWREVDGDVAWRKPETTGMQRRAHARVRLAHGSVGKSDECEARLRRLRGVDFDRDADRVNA